MATNYHQCQQTPLAEPEALEQYHIDAPEVLQLLLNLQNRQATITAYFDGGRHFIFSTIVGVLRSSNLVVLDHGPDEALAARALQAGRLVCASQLDGVSVRFTLESITKAQYEGRVAIAAPIPQSAYRIQRRHLLRIKLPDDSAATCHIPLTGSDGCTLALDDISCGGISVVDRERRFSGKVMEAFSGCLLSLPELGELRIDLQVRNCYLQAGESNVYRYGMQFLHLSSSDIVLLQRYITRLQMSNNARV